MNWRAQIYKIFCWTMARKVVWYAFETRRFGQSLFVFLAFFIKFFVVLVRMILNCISCWFSL